MDKDGLKGWDHTAVMGWDSSWDLGSLYNEALLAFQLQEHICKESQWGSPSTDPRQPPACIGAISSGSSRRFLVPQSSAEHWPVHPRRRDSQASRLLWLSGMLSNLGIRATYVSSVSQFKESNLKKKKTKAEREMYLMWSHWEEKHRDSANATKIHRP